MNKIKEAVLAIDIEIENKHKTCEKECKSLMDIRSKLRNICEHQETEYIPDASGNNDSYHICLICGLEKKRFKSLN